MAIAFIGASSAEATTVTIPAGHQSGDMIIIFAYRDIDTINPSIPANYTTITNTTDGTACAISAGWRLALSGAETSGTWTNTTGLVCHVYRNIATDISSPNFPISGPKTSAGATNTVTYATANPMKRAGTSIIAGFVGHRSLDTTIESPPSGLTMRTNTVGATAEYAGFDSNGPAASWPATDVAITGTASGWITLIVEIFAEQGYPNNYKFVDAGNGISVTEKIR